MRIAIRHGDGAERCKSVGLIHLRTLRCGVNFFASDGINWLFLLLGFRNLITGNAVEQPDVEAAARTALRFIPRSDTGQTKGGSDFLTAKHANRERILSRKRSQRSQNGKDGFA